MYDVGDATVSRLVTNVTDATLFFFVMSRTLGSGRQPETYRRKIDSFEKSVAFSVPFLQCSLFPERNIVFYYLLKKLFYTEN